MKCNFSAAPLLAILALFTFLPCKPANAQENEDGKIVKDTLLLKSGAKFAIGEKIQLGYGSNASKGFEFIYVSPYSWAGAGQKLPSNWAKLTLVIKKFEFAGSKKQGKKFYIVLGGGNIANYWCDIVPAMEQKEVIVKGINDAAVSNTTAAPASTPSLADELKKLKDLHDAKAITDKEYEAAKKKLLGT